MEDILDGFPLNSTKFAWTLCTNDEAVLVNRVYKVNPYCKLFVHPDALGLLDELKSNKILSLKYTKRKSNNLSYLEKIRKKVEFYREQGFEVNYKEV